MRSAGGQTRGCSQFVTICHRQLGLANGSDLLRESLRAQLVRMTTKLVGRVPRPIKGALELIDDPALRRLEVGPRPQRHHTSIVPGPLPGPPYGGTGGWPRLGVGLRPTLDCFLRRGRVLSRVGRRPRRRRPQSGTLDRFRSRRQRPQDRMKPKPPGVRARAWGARLRASGRCRVLSRVRGRARLPAGPQALCARAGSVRPATPVGQPAPAAKDPQRRSARPHAGTPRLG